MIKPCEPINYEELSPGVRGIVRALREQGFETCDSGDGTNLAEGMECAIEEPHVFMTTTREKGIEETERLHAWLAGEAMPFHGFKRFMIQMGYQPGEASEGGHAVIMMFMEKA